jgi:hypothetical protein
MLHARPNRHSKEGSPEQTKSERFGETGNRGSRDGAAWPNRGVPFRLVMTFR